MKHPLLNQIVLIRAQKAGLHYGVLADYNSEYVYLTDSRRIWSWEGGALSCSELSQKAPDEAKIACVVPHLTIPIADIGEVLLMSPVAVTKLNSMSTK